MEKIYFTQTGIDIFLKKIEKDENIISEMSSRLGYLAEVGGDQYHDNFSFEQQTMELRMLTNKLNNEKKILEKAIIIENIDAKKATTISIGSKVTIKFNQSIQPWEILGYGESDPKNYKTAYNTPLGTILIGKSINDVFDYYINSKKNIIKILNIE